MGYPEADVRAALTAARGVSELAYEFLENGIPDNFANPPPVNFANTPPVPVARGPLAPADGPLAQLRLHPQFTQLQGLIQANPASLNQVLELIGAQDPNLRAAIHANDEAFVAMMNEPIVERPPAPTAFGGSINVNPVCNLFLITAFRFRGGMPGFGSIPGGVPGAGEVDPLQLLQQLQQMPEAQRAQAAASMGLTPEQLQLALYTQMMGAMGGGGVPPGAQVIRLTPEELAAVRRLQEFGFTEQQAAQAFEICDRNEVLAANYLLDNRDDFADDGKIRTHTYTHKACHFLKYSNTFLVLYFRRWRRHVLTPE